ncbi:TadE family protein [Anaerolentibacter hominis]|uniref:TadE/TadG family type IV pilus assembly protein n=1 Tax=Anaerolentibacter hominis TaxID=3079009 RepID=UPI0031B84DBA
MKEKKIRGAVTVETAIALPLFLFAVLALAYLIQILKIQEQVGQTLYQTTNWAAAQCCLRDEDEKEVSYISLAVLYQAFQSYLPEGDTGYQCIPNGSQSIALRKSYDKTTEEVFTVRADYRVRPPVPFLPFVSYPVSQQFCSREFIGDDQVYDEGEAGVPETAPGDDQIVYMTESGTVYHIRKDCSHLTLTIYATAKDEVDHIRNEYGAKYYPCEKCIKKNTPARLLVAADGNRYHSSENCSGLKRTIKEVYLRDIPGIRSCSRCGGG